MLNFKEAHYLSTSTCIGTHSVWWVWAYNTRWRLYTVIFWSPRYADPLCNNTKSYLSYYNVITQ